MAIAQTKTSGRLRAGHKFIEGTLSVPLLQFDLGEEIRQQRQEDSWLRDIGRSSKTFVKHHDLRIVLISMKASTRMHEHKATARISVQTITGHVRLRLPEREILQDEMPTTTKRASKRSEPEKNQIEHGPELYQNRGRIRQ